VQWVDSGGVQLHTHSLGNGPLLVMCHGLITANLATWYFSAAPALARRYKVVLYDLRGHGKSASAATGYDLDTMCRDLACVVAAHGTPCSSRSDEKVALVGHSYGALIALNYALRHPREVSRLVLIDAPLPAARYVYPSLACIDSPSLLQDLLQAHEPLASKRRRRPRPRAAAERLEALLLGSSLREDVCAMQDIPDARLEALDVPTLCLYGRYSDCAAAGQRLARLLPHGELRWLECDHFIPTRAPGAMTEQLLSYFTA
jgi:pimeloyl-ACP methyl ester carboxylesterase